MNTILEKLEISAETKSEDEALKIARKSLRGQNRMLLIKFLGLLIGAITLNYAIKKFNLSL